MIRFWNSGVLFSEFWNGEGETSAKILAHPAFHEAMEEVQARLRDGRAEWHSFDETFAD